MKKPDKLMGVLEFFKRQHSEISSSRPDFVSNKFQKLEAMQMSVLEAPFSQEEIKQAICSCENPKSPRPDEFIFEETLGYREI